MYVLNGVYLAYATTGLWTTDELQQKCSKKDKKKLPQTLKNKILSKVQVLLLTVNDNEYLATYSLLEPIQGHSAVYTYQQKHESDQSGKSTNYAIYLIGRYGACVTAAMHSGIAFVPSLAFHCFPNLGAIINTGVACGVEKKSSILDIVVSSKVAPYDKARINSDCGKPKALSRGEIIECSPYLKDLVLNEKHTWPHASVEVYSRLLTANEQKIPKVHFGTIISGPYLVDNKDAKDIILTSFGKEAIGIEMEGAYLFRAINRTKIHGIVIKSVCDFGDGNKNKDCQPTAAVLAADFVKHILSESKPEMLLLDGKEQMFEEGKLYVHYFVVAIRASSFI